MRTIVVGFDGSPESLRAADWALDEARERGGRVVFLHARSHADDPGRGPVGETVAIAGGLGHTSTAQRAGTAARRTAEDRAEVERQHGEAFVHQALEPLADKIGEVDTTFDVVPSDRPGRTLVDRSHHADLVVVGSRGRGGFAGLLLGSVSQEVLHGASCPVVVVSRRVGSRADTDQVREP